MKMGEQMVTSLDNLTSASIQRNDIVLKNVISNKNLTNYFASLQADNTKLLQVIQALSTFPPATTSNQSRKTTKSKPNSDNRPTPPPWEPQG